MMLMLVLLHPSVRAHLLHWHKHNLLAHGSNMHHALLLGHIYRLPLSAKPLRWSELGVHQRAIHGSPRTNHHPMLLHWRLHQMHWQRHWRLYRRRHWRLYRRLLPMLPRPHKIIIIMKMIIIGSHTKIDIRIQFHSLMFHHRRVMNRRRYILLPNTSHQTHIIGLIIDAFTRHVLPRRIFTDFPCEVFRCPAVTPKLFIAEWVLLLDAFILYRVALYWFLRY
jgi:hypothetical protein